jgi:stage IV sporulation protein FB
MSNSTHIATVFGIPIKVHISLWIILPLLALFGPFARMGSGMVWGLAFAVIFFACIALHELGHSFVAIQKGCRVRQILLTPIGGIAMMDSMPDDPKDEILVAAAGPAVSLLLAFFFGFASMFLMVGASRVANPAIILLSSLAFTNFWLAMFNLIPSFPMDGGRIFRAWMVPKVGKLEATRRAAKIGRILAVAFGIVGLFSGSVVLVLIAVFIFFAAGAEYRAVQFQESFMKNIFNAGAQPRPASPPPPRTHRAAPRTPQSDAPFSATPPPYAHSRDNAPGAEKKKDAKRIKNVFDDLYSDWH